MDLLRSPLRIALIEPLPEWIHGIYASAFEGPEYDLLWAPDLNDTEIASTLSSASAIITGKRRVTEQLLRSAGPALRLIQVVGRAPWAVDMGSAREAGIPVSFLPHRGAIAVAEHTFALLIGLMRKLVPGHVGTSGADYQKLEIEPMDPQRLPR